MSAASGSQASRTVRRTPIPRSTRPAPATRRTVPHLRSWSAALAVALSSTFVLGTYVAYRNDIDAAQQRVASGGSTIATVAGPIQYSAIGAGAPVLMIHGAGGGYDQGEWLFRDAFANVEGYRVIVPSRF